MPDTGGDIIKKEDQYLIDEPKQSHLPETVQQSPAQRLQ
jgi:hypothetical protein